MPDVDGRLSKAEQETVKNWLRTQGADAPCPICKNDGWALADLVVLHQQFDAMGTGFHQGTGVPAVVVFCTQCTFMRFHSAVAIGLLEGIEAAPAREAKNA